MKKTRIRHLLALLLATGLLLLTSTLPVGAITPSYQVSSAYRKSTYYQNLLQLPLTGDGAFSCFLLPFRHGSKAPVSVRDRNRYQTILPLSM